VSSALFTASAQHDMIEQLAALETPVGATLRCSFLSFESCAGTSSVAKLVMRQLMRGRRDRALMVDTAAGQAAAGILTAGARPPKAVLERLPQEIWPWFAYRDGMTALAFTQAGAEDWTGTVGPVVKHFDVVGTDWGARSFDAAIQVAETGQRACIMGTFERDSAEAALAFATAVSRSQSRCRPVVVLSDVTRCRSTWPRIIAERAEVPVVAIPFDQALAQGRPASPGTQRRALQVAAVLASDPAATGTEGWL